jgi:hypothetical protein
MARITGSTDLYDLIHSMSPAEKGYFQKFALRHTSQGNKYLTLFNTINGQKEFEESSLKKKFSQYTVMKQYLFEMIQDSMLLFHKGTNSRHQILMQVLQIDYLLEKGLHDKAIKLTRRAFDDAHNMEQLAAEDILRRYLYRLHVRIWKVSERAEKDKEYFEDLQLIRDKQAEIDKYSKILQHVLQYNNLQSFQADYQTSFPKDFDDTGLFTETPLLTVTAERKRLTCLGAYYQLLRKFGGAYDAASRYYKLEKKLLEEKNPLAKVSEYRHALKVLIHTCLHTNHYDEAFERNKEFHAIKEPLKTAAFENEIVWFTTQQYIYWGSGRHKEGEAFTVKNLPHKLIEESGERMPLHVAEIYKSKVLFEYSNRNYKEVFKSIAELQALPLKKIAPGYYKSCEFLKILLQVEMDQFELIPQLVRNVLKHLPNYGLMDFEKEMLMLIRKAAAGQKNDLLKKLRDKITATGQEVILFNSFTLTIWLNILLENKPLNIQIAEGMAEWEKEGADN